MIHYGTYIFGGRSSAVDGRSADSAGGASWRGGRRGRRIGASLVNGLGRETRGSFKKLSRTTYSQFHVHFITCYLHGDGLHRRNEKVFLDNFTFLNEGLKHDWFLAHHGMVISSNTLSLIFFSEAPSMLVISVLWARRKCMKSQRRHSPIPRHAPISSTTVTS